MKEVKGYEIQSEKHIEELNAEGILLRHVKTGARVCLIACEDENKVFNIGFATPPVNDCGTAHIIEHSVLCGSKKYPAKDPFVELCKGSLYTFLNAMTYPEKTIYPVASCNDADFQNLMSVYLDAVFYPNIYENPKIFMQEGWHYEMESADSPLTVNGVVFNEMKGAFSQADGILDRYVRHTLFPDTPYSYESGGDPTCIPDLSYEDFLAFHAKYYHPSNAYIYLYGNMDMEEKLRWIDEEYLSRFDRQDYDIAAMIKDQASFDSLADVTIPYGISEEEREEESAYLSWNMVTGSCLDTKEVFAMQVLEYVLLGSPGALLRNALSQKGIGQDVYGGLEAGTKQTYFSVVAKGADPAQKELFLETIREELEQLVDKGISRKSLMAGIVSSEFKSREADFGRYPKGLILGMNLLDTWLHDETAAFTRLEYNEIYEFLKEQVDTGYYENLIRTKLLNNHHGAVVCAVGKVGLTEQNEALTAQRLETYRQTLTPEERQAIVDNTGILKAYQEEPTPKEILEKIPMIHVSDIKKETDDLIWEERPSDEEDLTLVFHNVFTSGIAYLTFCFDAACIPLEDYEYFGVFQAVFGLTDTEHFTYEELPDEVNMNAGGLSYNIASYRKCDETLEESNRLSKTRFEVRTRCLYSKVSDCMNLIAEIIGTSNLEQEDRILELLKRTLAGLEQKMMASGHSIAVNRAFSHQNLESYLTEKTGGVDFYHFLTELVADYDNRKQEMTAKLKELAKRIFTKDGLIVSITADEAGFEICKKNLHRVLDVLGTQKEKAAEFTFTPSPSKEAFTAAMQVNYSALCGNFKRAGFEYTGAMRVLNVSLTYDYLWTKLRVQGGAYGCMSGFSRDGEMYFTSYRDPEVQKTYDVYRTLPDYLRNYDADELEMEKNIIGAIGELDLPKTPIAIGSAGFSAYMTGMTRAIKQKTRDEILQVTVDDIRALAEPVRAVISQNCICTVGNLSRIEADRECFDTILPLLK